MASQPFRRITRQSWLKTYIRSSQIHCVAYGDVVRVRGSVGQILAADISACGESGIRRRRRKVRSALHGGDAGNFPTVCKSTEELMMHSAAEEDCVGSIEDVPAVKFFRAVVIPNMERIGRLAGAICSVYAQRMAPCIVEIEQYVARLTCESELQSVIVREKHVVRYVDRTVLDQSCIQWSIVIRLLRRDTGRSNGAGSASRIDTGWSQDPAVTGAVRIRIRSEEHT